jgi:uncharacterized protein GlcG (DUF336 family)
MVADVETVLSRAVAEARARHVAATIAVVDRVGNVLAVYRTANPVQVTLSSELSNGGALTIRSGLEGIRLPIPGAAATLAIDDQAAIAKAVTGAYLSSEGQAFSTRTASQIVQQNFNPGEHDQPSGPLFGVQFSQLACSDFVRRFNGVAPSVGPQRSPLGLAGDPGGFPLYKSGTPVGGVGVIADGVYGIDKDPLGVDSDVDEAIALAATFDYGAPLDRQADRITADGKTLRFSDVDFKDLAADPAKAPAFATLTPADGALASVRGYFAGAIAAGTAFGSAASGIRADGGVDFPGLDAFVFVDAADTRRYPPKDATDSATTGVGALHASDVRALLASALSVAERSRAQIRRPVGSTARVTIAVVDTLGNVLGMVRSRDAPVFGGDVALQKARTATLLSSAGAAAFLQALPNAKYIETTNPPRIYKSTSLGSYVDATRSFLGDPNALTGGIAFSARAAGNLARPLFPDGLSGTPNGPLSKVAGEWSVLSTGLQLDASINAILQHVLFVAGAGTTDVGQNCAGVDLVDLGVAVPTVTELRIANGLQIFPGGVPIYRGTTLVGGIGVSGDGVDQDDMVAFLGLHESGLTAGAPTNAPAARRADTLTPLGTRLRYVQCPQAPFVDSTETNVCDAK